MRAMASRARLGAEHGLRAALFTELVFTVFRAHGALSARGEQLLPVGLTVARWQVLRALATLGGKATVPTIARALLLTRQAVQKQVDLLLRQELVELSHNPAHSRSPLVALTRAGHEAQVVAMTRWLMEAGSLDRAITPEQLEGVRDLLEGMVTKLTADSADQEE